MGVGPRVWHVAVVCLLGAGGCGGDAGGGSTGALDGGASPSFGPGGGPGAPPPPQQLTFPRACSNLYDPDRVMDFELVFEPAEWQGLLEDCESRTKAYRPLLFRHDGVEVEAMVRLKGNWSFSCDKMQFVISFNELGPGRYRGLRKIVLDAPWYDPTLLHERLAHFVLERYGVPSSCINHARLTIDGAYYGLYANVERIDKEYLERHFEDAEGNLYQAGQELKTNEMTADTSLRDAFWDARDLQELEATVDLAQAVRVWAGMAVLPDPDSIWAGVDINFYMYEPPGQRLRYLPYDMDIAFARNIWPDLAEADPITYEHPEWGRETQQRIALSDPEHCAAFMAALRDARAAYDVPAMQSQLREWGAQIEADLEADPHRTFSWEERQQWMADMPALIEERAAFLDRWLARDDQCPGDF
ncbi:MAG: CotH kinase family protein [Myxococcales bacterium]|nr:CotH kinase family protein [Myxococcales bacterium]